MRRKGTLILSFLFILSILNGCAAKLGGGLSGELASQRYRTYEPAVEAKKRESSDKVSSQKSDKGSARMMVYRASLELEVANQDDAVKKVERFLLESKGFIEKSQLRQDHHEKSWFVIRVPAEHFRKLLAELETLGQVLQRSLSTEDITDQYQAMTLRQDLLSRTLARLQAMLIQVREIKEKIRILQEISRLQKELEQLRKDREYWANQAAYSTISLTIGIRQEKSLELMASSYFYWVRSLNPRERSLFKESDVTLPQPKDFFDKSKDFRKKKADYLYGSYSSTMIRTGAVENYPRGDLNFWTVALRKEMKQRNYELLTGKQWQRNGITLTYQAYEFIQGHEKRFYEILLEVSPKKINVVEIYYPDIQACKQEKRYVHQSIAEMKRG